MAFEIQYRITSVTPTPGSEGGEVRAVPQGDSLDKEIFVDGTVPSGLVMHISDFKRYERGGMLKGSFTYTPPSDEAVRKAEAESRRVTAETPVAERGAAKKGK